MSTFFKAIISASLLFFYLNSFAQWETIYHPDGNDTIPEIISINFSDGNNGFAACQRGYDTSNTKFYSSIIQTKDGGKTWSSAYQIDSVYFRKIVQPSPSTILAIGTYSNHTKGTLIKSVDGGISWDTSSFINGLLNIAVANDSVYFMIAYKYLPVQGVENRLLKSTDSGKTWHNTNYNFSGKHIREIKFIDDSTGFMYGRDNKLYRSSDQGNSWKLTKIDTANISLVNHISKPTNGNNIYMNTGGRILDSNFIYSSSDKGITWKRKSNLTYFNPHSFEFTTDSIAYVVSINNVLKTKDGGLSWEEQSCLIDSICWDNTAGWLITELMAVDKDTVYIATGTHFYRTYNGGKSLLTSSNRITKNQTDQVLLYPNPSNGIIHIGNTKMIKEIAIYTIQGQLIKSMNVEKGSFELPEPSGIYYIRIQWLSGMYSTQKIIKQ